MPRETLHASDLDTQSINTIRFLSADAVEAAQSGHPGTPMGLAPVAYVLWTRHLKHSPEFPKWPNRDRFVLSAGHASMLLYSLLHLSGYDLSLEEIKNFRQWGSKTPGHPEFGITPGVETTTGPLGQGFANGVGMALAERMLANEFNTDEHSIVDHYTYSICSDGDLMEGISHEAASLAGHLGLGKLVYLYDANDITIDGSTDLTFTEDVPARFRSYDWHVQQVEDAKDLDAVDAAITAAKAETDRPSLILVKSHIGYGSPNKQGSADSHGAPLGTEELRLSKENLGWPTEESFHVPDAVEEHMRQAIADGAEKKREWDARMEAYEKDYPEKAARYRNWQELDPDGGFQPYCGTFLIFSDYLRPSLRLSALMNQPVVYVFTHDSIGIGEDGPTHQPVEQLMSVRSIPNLTLIRPADANEAVEAWKVAIQRTDGPTVLALTRQTLPVLDRSVLASPEGVQRGAYAIRPVDGTPDVLLIGTGSEVQCALRAAETLDEEGIDAQVVSMPSWELFADQSEAYQRSVLPPDVTARVSIEAGVPSGWERFVGMDGARIGVDRFGASAPGEVMMEKYGFTAERVVKAARDQVDRHG